MPRWNAMLFVLAAGGAAFTMSAAEALADARAYNERAEAWLAEQPAGTPISAFPLVDGTYKGAAEQVVARDPSCPVARPGIISIGDRRLIFPYQPDVIFIAPVEPDGTLTARIIARPAEGAAHGTAQARRAAANAPQPPPIGSLDGRIGGGWLEFTVRTASCETRYRLRWVM